MSAMKCNAKTLNAIAETLVERYPGSAESAAIIRMAGEKLEAYRKLLALVAYPRRGTEEESMPREEMAARIFHVLTLAEVNGDDE